MANFRFVGPSPITESDAASQAHKDANKHPLSDMELEVSKRPKLPEPGHAKGLLRESIKKRKPRARMKHLSEDKSAIATTAMGRYKALMCTLDPFPSAKSEADLADRAWNETRENLGLDYMEPTKDVRSLVSSIALMPF